MEEIFVEAEQRRKVLKREGFLSRMMAELRRRKIQRAASICVRATAVKKAADVSMAMAARGRTAWSRAILLAKEGRMSSVRPKARTKAARFFKSLKFSRSLHTLKRSTGRCNGRSSSPSSDSSISSVSEVTSVSEVSTRMQTLRTLVPGGRGLDTPVLLKEVADYILALKMQVESMKTLVDMVENSASCAS